MKSVKQWAPIMATLHLSKFQITSDKCFLEKQIEILVCRRTERDA